MTQALVYNNLGEKSGDMQLDEAVWNVPPNMTLIQEVVQAYRANAREGIAHTKTRGEVRGGGRKPWKQKGTGRARHGSIRSPLWKGGGVVFGPRNTKNYTRHLNKKVKRKVMCMVLSNKQTEHRLVIIESLELAQPKTKFAVQWLHKLPVKNKSTLIALPKRTESISAFQNLPTVEIMPLESLNAYELLRYEYLMVPKDGIELISRAYSKK
ncbi:MAG: 50S ribosomal protein L4 [Candidatus Kerfeldbacteria bacterium RIFCSPHIGHO2_02_FULL_42_14]|uniref:Large ribosomal subunit protein uL4 n=1 Tax=Candidatus Kerfeldbacteria bacterium RIFCSPHIGHO2_02_FULL_42_14 TaxID=1798540 RepID=A0A1G2ARX9_9BACT|nr:MAG: 50S ribosomal protein L4 [Candidatus Kerfeldbacteria bacterium RIFCSPHIGHO2_02_FULL_42_14]OGY80425.1 MAG: 50S ribosomal protein L4 [Candidatus Kerfeldbacteria bacterium RIFCSPHIGHO2_12_FULL_42_13]OGY83855.1 MAG: 50S ribosomal protein L4 [Candidatus Kerfeldbacteria bacterium RIFCSPLOWO2_02_FULL_42_19]OGY85299.1 MAG: 50S ribosomal protein L4 [Candidatus Kerfeldbacteria bacterium RIFCSPLOWO2_12_FULL_43_9]